MFQFKSHVWNLHQQVVSKSKNQVWPNISMNSQAVIFLSLPIEEQSHPTLPSLTREDMSDNLLDSHGGDWPD